MDKHVTDIGRQVDNKLLHLHWTPLAVLMLFAIPTARAADYFDPAFLNVLGESETVDLKAFSQPGGVAPGEYSVAVLINQRSVGQHTLNFQKNAEDKIVPLLTPALLESWGVNVKNLPSLKDKAADRQLDNLSTLIPAAKTSLDLSRLRLEINIPQVAMQPNLGRDFAPELWDDGIPVLMANYNFSAGHSNSSQSGDSSTNNNLFASMRAGANAGPWRLRSTITYSHYDNSIGSSVSQTRFSSTTLSRDISALRSTLMLGETYSGSDIFDGVPFKGVKLVSNEQMLPSQLRGFAPAITGVANSNARVTIRQNGNIIYETYVAQGPFSINDIQQAGMSGNYDVTVTEANGTTRQFIVPYSSLPVMLRPGGWKYEISGGQYDGNLTRDSRQANFLLTSLIYGLPANITIYGGTLLADDYQAYSLGTGASLGNIGAISADITHANAHFSSGEDKRGESLRLRYSKSLTTTGTSVDLTALRYSTRDYFSFNEYNSQGYQLENGVNPWLLQRRRSSFQTQIRQQMGAWGSVFFRVNRDDYWNSDRTLTGLSAGYTTTLKGISYGINYNIDRIKDKNNGWPENRQIAANVSIPFSIFGSSSQWQSMYATSSLTHDNAGRTQSNLGLSGSLAGGNVSYSVAQSFSNRQAPNNTNANLAWQGSKGTLSGGYSYSNNHQSLNINGSGGVLLHSDGLLLSKTMGESMALISAPNAPDVSVNNQAGITNAQGYALAPYLSAYSRNSIGLDPSTLPEDVDLVQSNVNVYPTKGAVVRADFKTRLGYQVLFKLQSGSGVVPFGAIVTLQTAQQDEQTSSIVGDGGQVYLTGLPASGVLLVNWGESDAQQCRVTFDISNLQVTRDNILREVTLPCLSHDPSKPIIKN